MKFTTSRALMVSMLEQEQLDQVHFKEYQLMRCLTNNEICDMFCLPSIKERYGISDKDEVLAEYNQMIESKIREKGWIAHSCGEGLISEINVEKTHSYDFAVQKGKNEILWENPGNKTSLLDRIKNKI